MASELPFLFEAARDWSRASDYYLIAASHASGVFANQEAGALAHRGLEALGFLPDTVERAKHKRVPDHRLQRELLPSRR